MELEISGTDITCYGESTGTIDLNVIGSHFSYDYLWDVGYSTEDLTSVPAGNYLVTVHYNPNCFDTISYTLYQPSSSIENQIEIQNILCFGDENGSIDLSTSGGTSS